MHYSHSNGTVLFKTSNKTMKEVDNMTKYELKERALMSIETHRPVCEDIRELALILKNEGMKPDEIRKTVIGYMYLQNEMVISSLNIREHR